MHYEILQTNSRFIKRLHKIAAMGFMALVVVGLTATIIAFAGQDMFNNMSVVDRFSNGSADSKLGYLLLAIGLAWGSVFMGAALAYRKSQGKSAWIYGVGILAMSIMSGAFTMTATSSDAAGNAQASQMNLAKLKALTATQASLNSKMAECKKDGYFGPCKGMDDQLSSNAAAIASVDSSKVDIIAATPNGEFWHSIIVYGRSFVSPALCGIMMALLMTILLGRKTIKKDAVYNEPKSIGTSHGHHTDNVPNSGQGRANKGLDHDANHTDNGPKLSDEQIEAAILARTKRDKVEDKKVINRSYIRTACKDMYGKGAKDERLDGFIDWAKDQIGSSGSEKSERKGFLKLVKGVQGNA